MPGFNNLPFSLRAADKLQAFKTTFLKYIFQTIIVFRKSFYSITFFAVSHHGKHPLDDVYDNQVMQK